MWKLWNQKYKEEEEEEGEILKKGHNSANVIKKEKKTM